MYMLTTIYSLKINRFSLNENSIERLHKIKFRLHF